MKLTQAICYALFTITLTASCVHTEKTSQSQVLTDKDTNKRIKKREASIIVDNFPIETLTNSRPKVALNRISKQSYYGAPRSKYGPRPKYTPPSKVVRKPHRKYKPKKLNVKYVAPKNKSRSPKPKYGRPKGGKDVTRKHKYASSTHRRPSPGYSNMSPYNYATPEPTGFAEPPTDFEPAKSLFGEPPVDSYGAPLRVVHNELFHSGNRHNKYEPENSPDNYNNWDDTTDSEYAYTHKHHTFIRPSVFEDDQGEIQNLNSYSDVYRFSGLKPRPSYMHHAPKPDFLEQNKLMNKPWKAASRQKEKQLVVGGQYAEPPARYMNLDMEYAGSDFQSRNSYLDSEPSATVSPYVNYKNSNMAFSPQNLNDAFSIVD